MATIEQIRAGFFEMASKTGPIQSNLAKVKSVNEAKATCVLEDEDGDLIFDVRLRAVINNNKSFIQLPKVGSMVLTIRIEDTDQWMVVACDEITKIAYTVKDSYFEISDAFVMQAGGENMRVLIEALFTAIENMVFITNGGPTIALVNQAEFAALKQRFKKLLK